MGMTQVAPQYLKDAQELLMFSMSLDPVQTLHTEPEIQSVRQITKAHLSLAAQVEDLQKELARLRDDLQTALEANNLWSGK